MTFRNLIIRGGATTVCGSVLLCAIPMGFAQNAGDANATNSPASVANAPTDQGTTATSDSSVASAGAPVYVPSLSGQGLVRVGTEEQSANSATNAVAPESGEQQLARQSLLYGVNASTGYSFVQQSGQDISPVANNSTLPLLDPYIGLLGNLKKGGYLFQFSPTLFWRTDQGASRSPEIYEAITGMVNGAFTRRLGWTFDLSGSYGSQLSRFLSPVNVSSVTDAAADQNTAALLLGLENKEIQANAGYRLSWQKSRSQRVEITARTSYFDLFSDQSSFAGGFHSGDERVELRFSQVLSPHITLGTYGDVDRFFSGSNCILYGGGAELGIGFRRSLQIALRGGPQSAGACGDTQFEFHGTISSPVISNPQVYVRADRELTSVFGHDHQWQDNAGIGVLKSFRRSSIGADFGFSKVESSSLFVNSNGYFFDAIYNRSLSRQIGVAVAFRNGSFLAQSGQMRILLFSLNWHPSAVPLGSR